MSYNLLEAEVINKLLSYNNDLFSLLNKQFQFLTVINREESSADFYTKIDVDNPSYMYRLGKNDISLCISCWEK